MSGTDEITRFDYKVLFWVAGSVRGATLDEIVEHESFGHTSDAPADSVNNSLQRLERLQLIHRDGDRYFGDPDLQRMFLNECRNCRDTIEEVSVLRRLVNLLKDEDAHE